MRSWRRVRELSAPELRLLASAFLLLPWVALRLRWQGLAAVRGAVELPPLGRGRGTVAASRIAFLVAAAARRHPVRVQCLARALALQWLLRRHGVASELRVGVRKEAGRLEAHAWVEHEGRPLMEAGDVHARYAPFEPLAGSRAP